MKLKIKLTVSFLFIGILIVILGGISLNQLTALSEPLNNEIPSQITELHVKSDLDAHAQLIRYYDEVLTQSARNYAFTLDKKWEQRYFENVPLLDKNINHAIEKGDKTEQEFFQSVNIANLALIDLEIESINFANDGNSAQAVKILQSEKYWDLKEIYEKGLRDYVSSRGLEYDQALTGSSQILEETTKKTQEILIFSIESVLIFVIFGVASSIFLGFIISKSITKPIESLNEAVNCITEGKSDVQIKIKSPDEFRELVNSFNSMSYSLAKSKKLQEKTQSKYRNLYENSPALNRTIGKNGIILDCNKSYAERLGYTKSEIIGTSIFLYSPPEKINELRKSFENWKNTGVSNNHEVWLKTKSGKVFPALVSANNLYDDDGVLIGSNTVFKDISEYNKMKKAQEERDTIQSKMEHYKQVEIQRNAFASMVSHELKSPLSPILGYCEFLQDKITGELNYSQKEAVEEIAKNAKHLEKLIEDVLDVQRLDMKKLQFNKTLFEIDDLFNELAKKYSLIASKQKIHYYTTTFESIKIETDYDRLKQIFDNLIRNAMDFVEENGRIDIGAYTNKSELVFYVKDTGIGIHQEKIGDLFKKFYQVDTSHTRKHGGTGLGLVICKGIVEGLGGKIWVESEVLKGTTFFFSIPYDPIIYSDNKHGEIIVQS